MAIRGLKMAAFFGPEDHWRKLAGPEGLLLSLAAAVYLLLTVVKQSSVPNTEPAGQPSGNNRCDSNVEGTTPVTCVLPILLDVIAI